MPHLTPIRWITAIIFIWLLISTINLIQWRIKPIKFIKDTNKFNYLTNKFWTWNLQDGR